MAFTPTKDQLIPDLSPREEIVLLARALWKGGYRDNLAGHITYNNGDGTLLCNPWYLTWEEFNPEDVLLIDLEGNLLEGDWPVPLGIPLHLALHKARPNVTYALHNHSEYGTVWADIKEIPPMHDQSSSLGGGGDLVLVEEYDGGVDQADAAESAIEAFGDAEVALLGGHGVFVTGNSAPAVYLRAASLELRCKNAWMVRVANGPEKTSLPDWWVDQMTRSDGSGYTGFWESAVRAALRDEPELLGKIASVSR